MMHEAPISASLGFMVHGRKIALQAVGTTDREEVQFVTPQSVGNHLLYITTVYLIDRGRPLSSRLDTGPQ